MRPGPMKQLVARYYGLMPRNTTAGWRLLGPNLKRQGYRSYTRFWRTIRSVGVSNLRADAKARTVTATVTFLTTNGVRSVERHRFGLVTTPDGSGLLIDTDRLL